METKDTTPAIRLPKDAEWKPGRAQTWDTRHTITARAAGNIVDVVYDVSGRTYRFVGVERPKLLRAEDGSPIHSTEHLGYTALSRAVWMRLYKADAKRRSYWA